MRCCARVNELVGVSREIPLNASTAKWFNLAKKGGGDVLLYRNSHFGFGLSGYKDRTQVVLSLTYRSFISRKFLSPGPWAGLHNMRTDRNDKWVLTRKRVLIEMKGNVISGPVAHFTYYEFPWGLALTWRIARCCFAWLKAHALDPCTSRNANLLEQPRPLATHIVRSTSKYWIFFPPEYFPPYTFSRRLSISPKVYFLLLFCDTAVLIL